MTDLREIRSTFLDYFKKKGHSVQPSGSLIPSNDPTLMFANSGMVQFKDLFTGLERRNYSRAATAQKCVRAGGKHNDLDNVGYTARHHTFFEMLGNFSFGDYFKEDAILFAWELLTKEFMISKEKLYVTVYHSDEEAVAIWKKVSGFTDDKIIRISTDDNFWSMGPTGPCGPSSEIFYDHGEHIWGGPPGSPEEDGDRFVEIWNLVFMQYEQFEDGSRSELPNQSIDTGMGIERVAALLQGTNDNYNTDLMRNLIEASGQFSGTDPYGDQKVHHRVISDHLRSCAFLIADGVMPSKDGRGYVLRRIMRRAMRHAYLLGVQDPLMHQLVPSLIKEMGDAYPELAGSKVLIEETLKNEEARFKDTLGRGLKLLDEELVASPASKIFSGTTAFKLYDTFGFPLDLTQDALREKGIEVDISGFNNAMVEQKKKARASWAGSGQSEDMSLWFDIADEYGGTDFLGYEYETSQAQVIAIITNGKRANSACVGDKVQVVFNQTPFYAEAGGQVGDTGVLNLNGDICTIVDCKKLADIFIHSTDVLTLDLSVGSAVELSVSSERRDAIKSNHSATHLLNEALRVSLGEHVTQRGSLNSSTRLRFDFNHNKALTREELCNVESEVNSYIRQNSVVETRVMTPDEARNLGAQALFGEKYGDEVRVVSMGNAPTGRGLSSNTYSIELCGGIHVNRTGSIGSFLILGDSASSAGVRRIEALTGVAATNYIRVKTNQLTELELVLKTKPGEVNSRVLSLIEERKSLISELSKVKKSSVIIKANDKSLSFLINDFQFDAKVLKGVEGKEFPSIIDDFRSNTESGIILLIGGASGKVSVAIGITSDLTKKYSAIDLVRAAVKTLGGQGGGGRPDLAQGGARNIEDAELAIETIKKMIGD
jgi:alanyl-tRNA synthetase